MGIMKLVQTFSGGLLYVGVGVGRGEGVTWEDISMEELFMRKRISMRVEQDFLALFKKSEEIHKIKTFSTRGNEQH